MDYAEALEKALAAANSGQAQADMAAAIAAGNDTYNQLAQQVATNRLMEEARLMQRMADLGVTAPPSLTVQNNSAMAGMRDIGDVRRQNQAYTDVQNAMLDQANANAAAQAANITANINAASGAAALDEEMSKFETYYRLTAAGKMTRSAFKKLTGIDIRAYKPKVKKPTDPNEGFEKNTEKMAAEMYTAQAKGKAEGDALERYYNGSKQTAAEPKTNYENQQAKSAADKPAASTYDDYEKQLGVGKYFYRGRLKQLKERPENFLKAMDNNWSEYDRWVKYYETKAAMEEYGLDQNVIAPGYVVIDDMINNRSAYINKYGAAGYNKLFDNALNWAKPDIESIDLAVTKKNSGLYNANILNAGTWLRDMFAYDETSADDMMNAYLGYAPNSFNNAARDIIDRAEAIKKSRADANKTTGEIAHEAANVKSDDYWGNKPITEQELRDAIKIINEDTGDVSVEEHYDNLAIIEYAKQNPQIYGNLAFKGQPLSAVDINNISSKSAAELAEYLAGYKGYAQFKDEQRQKFVGYLLDAQEEKQKNALPTDLAGIDKMLEEETAKLKQYKDEYEASGKTYFPHGGTIPFTYTSYDKDKEAQYNKQKTLVERLKVARQQMYNGLTVQGIDARMQDVQAKIAEIKNVPGKERDLEELRDEEQELKDARYYAVLAENKAGMEQSAMEQPDFNSTTEAVKQEIKDAGHPWFASEQNNLLSYILLYRNDTVADTYLVSPKYGGPNINGGSGLSFGPDPGSVGKYKYISDDEINVLAYYYGKGDNEGFDTYINTISRELDRRYVEVTDKDRKEFLDSLGFAGKVLGVAGEVANTVLSGRSYFDTLEQTLKNAVIGKYEPVNLYGSEQQYAANAQKYKEYVLEGTSGFLRWLGETGFSVANFAVTIPLGPTGALVATSVSAAGQATYDALERGATPEQALLEGTLYGVIEAVTEKLPLDKLFKLAKSGAKLISKEGIKNLLKQAGIEATEGYITELMENLTDYAVMGDKSQIGLRIQELIIDEGMSRADAERQAGLEFFLYNPLKSAGSGFVSGLLTSRAEDMISNHKNGRSKPGGAKAVNQTNNTIPPPPPGGPAPPRLLNDQGVYENNQGITPQSLQSPVTPSNTPHQNLQTPSIPAAPGTRRAGQKNARKGGTATPEGSGGGVLQKNTGLGVYDIIPESAAPVYEGYAAKMNRAGVGDVISRYSDPVETTQNRKGQDVRVRERTYSEDNAAEVVAALEQSYKTGTKEQQQKMLVIALEVAPSSGRAIDKMQLLSKLNATGRKFAIERELGRLNAFGRQKYKARWKDLSLTDAEIKAIKKARNQMELDRARKEILKRLGDAMPATMAEKSAALSKIAGQLNPLTHIKGFVRNSLAWAVIEAKDKVAAVAGLFARRELRTTSFLVGKDKKAKVNNYYKEHNVADEFSKYKAGGSPLGQKRVFKSGALEAASKGMSKVSGKESLWFMADRYKRTLGRYMQAQGLTEVTPGAHEYAMNEAVKAVNGQKNAVTRALAKIRGIKGLGAALDFAVPSAETKVNAAIRKLEYSPFGIGKAGYDFIRTLDASRRIDKYVKQMKTASPAEIKDLQARIAREKDSMRKYAQKAINDLAQGITGTGLYFLGLLLASGKLIPGVEITGLEPPTEEDDFLKSTGWQPLSLKIGNTYISLDWAEPISSMILVGAETYHAVEESGANSWYAVPLETLFALGEDILKSSGFSGISDALRDYKDAGSALVGVGSELVSQHIPTLGSAVNNIIEPYKISGGGSALEKARNKAIMMVPGLRRALESAGAEVPAAATDAWGQPVSAGSLPERLVNNLVSPAKITRGNSDSVTSEIKRLYDATGNAGVFPLSAGAISNELTLDKLTKREAAQIQDEVKQGFYDVISAYMSSAQYQADNDDAKVRNIKGFYDSFMDEYRKQYLLAKIPSAPKAAVGP